MGNALKNKSTNAAVHVNDSALRPPNANNVTIRVIPNPTPPPSQSPSSESPSTTTSCFGRLSINSSRRSPSILPPSFPHLAQEQHGSNTSLSLKSFKSQKRAKDHKNRSESELLPEPSLPPSPFSMVTRRSFTDLLSDALQLQEDDKDKPPSVNLAAQEEVKTPKRDWIRDYFENIKSSNVSEEDIEQRRYYIFKRVWSKDIQVPLKDPTLIVHWACGAGPWETSVARQFPTCRVVGIDFHPCHKIEHSEWVEFRELSPSVQDEYHGLDGFQDSSVDLLVMRRVWFLGADTYRWAKLLGQALKILKPGGWIEIYDVDRPVVPSSGNPNDSKCLAKIEGWRSNIRKVMVGISMERKQILRMLIDAGFIQLNGCCIGVPVGEWASTQDLKETGYLVKDLRWRYIKQVGRWIQEINGISAEEFQETVNATLREVEQCRAYMNWICVTAQKPDL